MKTKSAHIVHKISCEVFSNNSNSAQHLQHKLGDWLKTGLLPLIEQLLDNVDDHTGLVHHQIPELKVELESDQALFEGKRGVINSQSNDRLLDQMKIQLTEQLKRAVENIDRGNAPNKVLFDKLQKSQIKNTSSLSHFNREIQTICHLLKSGTKPWWMGETEKAPLFFSNWNEKSHVKDVLEHPAFIRLLKESAHNDPIRQRLIKQFTVQQNRIMYDHFMQKEYGLYMDQNLINSLETESGTSLKLPLWDLIWRITNVSVLKDDFQQLIKAVLKQVSHSADTIKLAIQQTLLELIDWAKTIHKSNKNWLDEEVYQKLSSHKVISKNEIEALFTKENIHGADSKEPNSQPDVKGNSLSKPDRVLGLENINFESYSSISGTISNQIYLSKTIDNEHNGNNKSDLQELHVEQAGLILLHPFLKELFLETNLITPTNEFTDQDRAVLLLHYLATKEDSAFDHELIFEKFCCGKPLETAVNRELKLPQEIKVRAEELLKAIVGHWAALKGTGSDTLRAEFLCRRGKLVLKGKYPKLVLDRKTQDILLNKLPWGISMAKFPWKKELLFVQW